MDAAQVVLVDSDGHEHIVDAAIGESLMDAAVKSGVPGIVAECGGNMSCATCHVWVREQFLDTVGEAIEMEDDILDLAVTERRSGSRLSCQILLTPVMDGLTVDIPPDQP